MDFDKPRGNGTSAMLSLDTKNVKNSIRNDAFLKSGIITRIYLSYKLTSLPLFLPPTEPGTGLEAETPPYSKP